MRCARSARGAHALTRPVVVVGVTLLSTAWLSEGAGAGTTATKRGACRDRVGVCIVVGEWVVHGPQHARNQLRLLPLVVLKRYDDTQERVLSTNLVHDGANLL